jgi:hypothetical protein
LLDYRPPAGVGGKLYALLDLDVTPTRRSSVQAHAARSLGPYIRLTVPRQPSSQARAPEQSDGSWIQVDSGHDQTVLIGVVVIPQI